MDITDYKNLYRAARISKCLLRLNSKSINGKDKHNAFQ